MEVVKDSVGFGVRVSATPGVESRVTIPEADLFRYLVYEVAPFFFRAICEPINLDVNCRASRRPE